MRSGVQGKWVRFALLTLRTRALLLSFFLAEAVPVCAQTGPPTASGSWMSTQRKVAIGDIAPKLASNIHLGALALGSDVAADTQQTKMVVAGNPGISVGANGSA